MTRSMLLIVPILAVMAQAAAMAQQEIPEPQPDKPWLAILYAVVLALGTAAASVMTPKRTHQD